MLFFLLILSCIKSINFKSKVFPLEILQNFEEDENYNYLKELGLLDTLNNMSKILLSEPVTFSKYERDILQSILNRDISSFTGIYEGKGFSNEEELSLLHYAALVGAEDIFEYLVIQKKEDIKKRDYYGRTCLHFAFLSKNFNLCRKVFSLLEQEDKEELLNAKDRSGASCFHYLAFSNLFERYKIEKEIEQNTLINFITFSEDGGLKLSIGSNFKDDKGLTPLHYAAYFGDLELCKEFLDGIDEGNVQSEEIEGLGRITPLGMAYISRELEVIKYFEESNLKVCEEDLKLKEFFELDRDKEKDIFVNPKVRHIDVKAIDNESIVDQEDEEITKNSSLEEILGYFSEKGRDLGQKLQKEKDEFLKHKDEKGEEILYLAIDREDMKKRQDKEALKKKENKFQKLIKEKKEEILILTSYVRDKGVILRYLEEIEVNTKDKDERTILSLASFEGHKELIELLIEKVLEIDSADRYGRNALHIASLEGDRLVVEILISRGAEIDLADKYGRTPLCIVSYEGHKEVVELLISNGARIDLSDKYKRTPLYIASEKGYKEVVEILIKNGAAIDLVDKWGATPLWIASCRGHKEVVELLLEKGAAINLTDKDGRTGLWMASQNGHKEVVELLLAKGAKIDLAKNNGSMELIISILEVHKEVLKLLITKGTELGLLDKIGGMRLHTRFNYHTEVVESLLSNEDILELSKTEKIMLLYKASSKGHKEVVELLIEKVLEIDSADRHGRTALHIASLEGDRLAVEILILQGAEMDLADKYGRTSLCIVSYEGHKEVVELLISKGARIDLRDKYKRTPLYIASEKGHKEIVEILIKNGAAINLVDKWGVTPLWIASCHGHKEVVELLIKNKVVINLKNDKGETPLYIASQNGHKEIAELLLTNGATIDLADKLEVTPLCISNFYGNKEVMKLLIANGAELDLGNNYGLMPFCATSLQGHKEILKMLILKGASIDMTDRLGVTPFLTAKEYCHKEKFEILTKKDSSIDLTPNDGLTQLFIESEYGYKEVLELLIKNGVEIDLENNLGMKLLYTASALGHKEIVELLIEKGAVIDLANEVGITPLFIASCQGHKEVVEMLINKGADVDKADNYRRTPLYAASEQGNQEIVELLIENGAEINSRDYCGRTPLRIALLEGHREVVEFLSSKGAIINKTKFLNETPLCIASKLGKTETVELLLSKGAEIDETNRYGRTALYIASKLGRKKIVELLLAKRAKVNLIDQEGRTALWIASQQGHNEVVEALISKAAEIDLPNNFGMTPLCIASKNGNKKLIELLLTKGAAINKSNICERTPLYIASAQGHKEVVELLLSKGALIDLEDKNRTSPLHIASQNGYLEVVELLLTKGANPDTIFDLDSKKTILIWAIEKNHRKILELLIEKGAVIDLADKDGSTPLYIASKLGKKKVVRLLINKGAAIDLANQAGTTPLMIASHNGNKEVVELLIENGASIDLGNKNGRSLLALMDGDYQTLSNLSINERSSTVNLGYEYRATPLMIAIYNGHKEVVELLLKNGAAIDLAYEYGATPLMIASHNGNKEVVELLIENGASIDLAINGFTPLYIASMLGKKGVVELLLSNGASIDLGMSDGRTSLYIASKNGHKEVVEFLIEKKAATDLADGDGRTPLLIATFYGHKEVVKLLLTKGTAIDLADKNGTTSLLTAIKLEDKEVVELLIEKGAKVDLANYSGETPLYIASKKGNQEVVEFLLSKGAAPNLAQKEGETPLFIASSNGYEGIVNLLIENGANPNTTIDKDSKKTILIWAIERNYGKIVELLIENGASIDLSDKDGRMPMYIALCERKKDIMSLLIAKGANVNKILNESNQDEINFESNDKGTILSVAIKNGYKEESEILIKNGADLNMVDKYGRTVLMIASQESKKEIIKLLLQNKVNIPKSLGKYRKSELIEQAINYASEINDSSFCFNGGILLIRNSLDIYEKLANLVPFSYLKDNFFSIPSLNTYGYNSLHIAIFQAKTVNLKKLLSDDNIKEFINSYDNKEKESCLALAIRLNKLEHAKDLLSFFASPIYFKNSLLGSKQINVLDIEEVKNYVSNIMIFEVLKDRRTEDAGKLLFGHTRAGSSLELKINNFSYKDKINLKALDGDGRNFFHLLAIYAFDDNDLDHLFSRSATIPSFSKELMYSFDKSGMTPFHYAILNANEHFVKYYLASEEFKIEDVMKGTKEGKSVSDLIRKESISKEIINLFIKYIWSIKDSDLYNFISSKQNNINDKCSLIKAKLDEMNILNDSDNNVIYSIMKSDDKELLLFILDKINLNDKKIEDKPIIKEELLVKALRLAIQLNALNCLNELLSRVPKQELSEIINLETLFKSCVENKSEIIAALAKVSEEQLGEKDSEGNTILHIACLNRKEEVVRELLEYGSVIGNINSKNEQGNTAMHNAHMALSPSLISTLKEKGADISIENNRGKKAINLLKDRNTTSQEEIIQIGTIYASLCAMLEREYDADYELTIHLAVLAKEEWVIKDLSTRGLINSLDEEENTPLHIAIKEDNKDMVKALLERGANFFLKNKIGETSLELVSSKEVLMIVINEALNKNIISEYLLNIQNKEGNTLLHLVVERSKIKVFEEEIETKSGEIKQIKREEIDKKDKQLIETLLDNGANKDKFNKKSKTPLDIASQKSKMLEDILLKHEPLLSIMRFREGRYFLNKEEEDKRKGRDQEEEKEVVEVLNNKRRHDIDLSSRRRAIHLVVERNDEYALEVLLDKGSDPEWEDLEGKNCYEIAVSRGSIDAFKMLMKQGDIFKESKHHASPIYISVEKGGKYFEAVSERIREECKKGYKIESLRDLNIDPVSKVIENDDKRIMEKFLDLGINIVDEGNRNLLIEAIIKDRKQVFNYLIGRASEEEIKGVDREKKTAIEEAQIKSVKDRDSYYARSIQERLKNLKKDRE